jgi:Protein of unknown function (DUF2752).
MKKKAIKCYQILTILLPLFTILLYHIRGFFLQLLHRLPPCLFYSAFHLYCPACGNTRSVTALLQGDLVQSLRYNISPVLFGLFLLLAYLELASYSFGHYIKLLPRRLSFYLILLVLLISYVIIRNFFPYLTP